MSETETGDCLVPLAREYSFEFIADLLDRLEKANVPYVVEAGTALKLLDTEAAVLSGPEPWEARVWVTQSAENEAKHVLEEVNAAWQSERGNQAMRRYLDVTGRGKPGAV